MYIHDMADFDGSRQASEEEEEDDRAPNASASLAGGRGRGVYLADLEGGGLVT